MAESDNGERVLVIVMPAVAHSPGELVRVGFRLFTSLDDGALELLQQAESDIVVTWAASDYDLREIIAEAVINDEWLSVLRRENGDTPRAIAVGPVYLESSPLLSAAVARSKEFGHG